MALGEKTVLDLFTGETDIGCRGPLSGPPGAAFSFAHKFTESNLNTGKAPAVILTEIPRVFTGVSPRLALTLVGQVGWVMSPGPGSNSPAGEREGVAGVSFS